MNFCQQISNGGEAHLSEIFSISWGDKLLGVQRLPGDVSSFPDSGVEIDPTEL
jgi:hypothetical protein